MKKTLRFILITAASLLLLLTVAVPCSADGSLRYIFMIDRADGNPNDTPPKTANLLLGDLSFKGLLYPPVLKTLSREELDALVEETMKQFGIDEEELETLAYWGADLNWNLGKQALEKAYRIYSNLLPGAAGDVAGSATLIYDGYQSVGKDKAEFLSVARGAGNLVLTHEIGKIDGSKLKKLKKLPGYGGFAIGTMLAAEEALSTKQYDQFREKSEKNFQKAAEFFSVLVKKVNRLLEEKNKDHSGGMISFLPVTSIVRDKTIYGIRGFSVAYTLSGSLYQEVQTGGDPTYLQDPRGIYTGTLSLSIEVEGMEYLDDAFVEGCCLPNGELNETADWRQILKRFPDRPEIRKTLLAAFIDRTVSPAKLTRNLSGEFTATITSENGLGKAQLSGAFNSLSDETDFQFSHSIFTLFLAPKAIETPNGPENLGQPQYNVILTSVPGAGLSQIHVRVTDANRAATVSDDTTYTEFSGDGRALVIPVSKQGDVFDQLPYPPGIIITK